MSKPKKKKIKKPRLPIEAVLKLKKTHAHEPKKYNRTLEKRKIKDILKEDDSATKSS